MRGCGGGSRSSWSGSRGESHGASTGWENRLDRSVLPSRTDQQAVSRGAQVGCCQAEGGRGCERRDGRLTADGSVATPRLRSSRRIQPQSSRFARSWTTLPRQMRSRHWPNSTRIRPVACIMRRICYVRSRMVWSRWTSCIRAGERSWQPIRRAV